jgi:hypothetical protein
MELFAVLGANPAGRATLRTCLLERRFDSNLVGRLNEYAEVMAENLAQNLIDLNFGCLRADTRTELGLDHVERGFHVRAKVIVAEKVVAPERAGPLKKT